MAQPSTTTAAQIRLVSSGGHGEDQSSHNKGKSERVKSALAKLRAKGVTLGRPKGAKDKKKRRRTGYLLRFADKERKE